MLTAVRAMAHRVAHDLAHMDTPRLGPDADAEEQDELLAEVLESALEAGKEAVERGPEQLAVLREAGVVDAGAYGLTVVAGGRASPRCAATCRPSSRTSSRHARAAPPRARVEQATATAPTSRSSGEGLEAGLVRRGSRSSATRCWSSATTRTLRVHVHTDEPDAAAALFDGAGEVSRFDVADMHEQVAERSARLSRGDGAASRGTRGLRRRGGGQRARGCTRLYARARRCTSWRAARPSTPPPTSCSRGSTRCRRPRGDRAAQQPERDPGGRAGGRAVRAPGPGGARPAPQQSRARGPARLRPGRLAAGERRGGRQAPREELRTGGVAQAARDDAQGRFSAGDAIGYAGERAGRLGRAERGAARRRSAASPTGAELLTCLAGDGAPLGASELRGAAARRARARATTGRSAGLVVPARRRVARPPDALSSSHSALALPTPLS